MLFLCDHGKTYRLSVEVIFLTFVTLKYGSKRTCSCLAKKVLYHTGIPEIEREALEKHEYYRGEIFAMPGAGARHNIILVNILVSPGISLKGKSCRPYGSDMRIHIPENSLFTYPDISIICGEVIQL